MQLCFARSLNSNGLHFLAVQDAKPDVKAAQDVKPAEKVGAVQEPSTPAPEEAVKSPRSAAEALVPLTGTQQASNGFFCSKALYVVCWSMLCPGSLFCRPHMDALWWCLAVFGAVQLFI